MAKTIAKLKIWLVEDDELSANYWKTVIKDELGCDLTWFETQLDIHKASGNPNYIIFDVGNIGLGQSEHTYLRAFEHLRGRFENTPLFLVSGLRWLPEMLQEEFPDDKLIFPLCSTNYFGEMIQKVRELERIESNG